MKRSITVLLAVAMCMTVFLASCKKSAELVELVEYLKTTLDEAADTDLIDTNIAVRGNSIVYEYTYKVQVDNPAVVKEALLDALSGEEEQILSYLETMRTESGTYIESLIYEYYTIEGELIASREFK